MTDGVRVRVELNSQYDLRRAPGVVALTTSIGKRVLDTANRTLKEGEGYAMSSQQGSKKNKGRWAVRVYTRSIHAMHSNAKHNTLIRAMESARH